MDAFGRVIAILLSIILIIIFPIQYLATNQKYIIDDHVQYETKKFTDEIMLRGYVSLDMYEEYLNNLNTTSQLYDIDFIRSKPTESFSVSSGSESHIESASLSKKSYVIANNTNRASVNKEINTNINLNDTSAITVKNISTVNLVKTEKEEKIITSNKALKADYYNSLNINTIVNTGNINPLIKKIHYNNQESIAALDLKTKINSFSIHTHTDACYTPGTTPCTGIDYDGNGQIDQYDCIRQDMGSHETYTCRACNTVVYTYAGYMGSGHFWSGPHGYISTLSCYKVVTSITPTSPNQSVNKGQNIDATATATYLDGHTETINCSNNYNSDLIGNQTVTLTYSGLVDNATTTGTKSCTVNITVKPNKYPISLTVTPSSNTVYNGSEPSYSIQVNYNDGTSKIITEGYTKAGFTSGAGTKTVTFTYTENNKTVSTNILITVKRNVKTCINGHTYELDDYDNDWGCPVCKTTIASIKADPSYITLIRGQSLNIKITATYLDGHTVEVIGWTSNFDSNKVGNQLVTINYNGYTTTINVTVKNEHKLKDINIEPSSQSIERYSYPSFIVKVIYEDDENWKQINDYTVKGFDNTLLGTQTVTISYSEAGITLSKSVSVTVKRLTKICPICGLKYELDDNNVDHGCPHCSTTIANIKAEPSNITLIKGDSLNIKVTATYLDGHTVEVVGWTSNFDSNMVGNQLVTINYNGYTTTINVTVKNKHILKDISIEPPSQSIERYSYPSFIVKVIYEDDDNWKQVSDYTVNGLDITLLGTQTVTISYTEAGIKLSKNVSVTVKRLTNICPICGLKYELDDNNFDHGCPDCSTKIESIKVTPKDITVKKGDYLNIKVTVTYKDQHTDTISEGWSSNFDNTKLGKQVVTVSYKGVTTTINVTVTNSIICPICNTAYPVNEDGSDPGCPICKKTVVSIKATPELQIIKTGESITLQVTATYKDGHKEEITDWTSNFNAFKVGKQVVTVSYKTISTNVNVNVESDTETTCPVCSTVYSIIQYPYGCPKCAETITGIEARLRNGGTQVQYGSELNLYVVLLYRDNHRVISYSDWSVEGYHSDVLGHQTVTVKYKEFQTTLDIEVVNTLIKKVCPNGHVYYLNEDGSDPGCPYCNVDPTLDSSEGFSECVYTEEILNKLYTDKIYYLEIGDYITITVKPKSKSFLSKIGNIFHLPIAEDKKYRYGGMIGNGE